MNTPSKYNKMLAILVLALASIMIIYNMYTYAQTERIIERMTWVTMAYEKGDIIENVIGEENLKEFVEENSKRYNNLILSAIIITISTTGAMFLVYRSVKK